MPSMYYLTKLISRGEDGLAPELPAEVDGFLAVASGTCAGSWVLCEVAVDQSTVLPSTLRTPGSALAELLRTSSEFPAPVALAARALRRSSLMTGALERFEESFCHLLRHYLALQRRGAFLLVASAGDEPGYRTRGELVWAVARRGSSITWVSRDFQIYEDDADGFAWTGGQLEMLSSNVPPPSDFIEGTGPKCD